MLTSIIYQNVTGTTTLLDLPVSIQNGQCLQRNEPNQGADRIRSAECPKKPYPNVEPKGLKRRKLLHGIPPAEREYHENLQALIYESLEEIRSAIGPRKWLFARQPFKSPVESHPQGSGKAQGEETSSEPPIILSSISNVFTSMEEIAGRMVSNPSSRCTSLVADSDLYRVPPRSTFILSGVEQLCPGTRASTNHFFPRAFDLIVMDPPWQNRSVRHAKVYRTSQARREDPFLSVLPILHSHLRPDGLVGIWVTNKASIRRLVLHSLREKGLQLYEEWVWMKTTVDGEPVTPLDGLWRRPYEVLLLFRKGLNHKFDVAAGSQWAGFCTWATGVHRRLLVAVPGHHSQKPCLKELIEPLLVDSNRYDALEMFARNLTAGWFACGNEVLKFNHQSHWARTN
ncbi:hypothetical protein GJ744_011227 [Endocarpon pusillum]|uniref:Methyltransferase-like protein 4 n=1 Tax=Endocarpon pusillum TaxID=364733 RepID=A0A8H7ATY3_9EURO|nr:hypothetical protein GJ744_011227 [Endocarpon pusillum]